jgi:hypothetical protein
MRYIHTDLFPNKALMMGMHDLISLAVTAFYSLSNYFELVNVLVFGLQAHFSGSRDVLTVRKYCSTPMHVFSVKTRICSSYSDTSNQMVVANPN